MPPDNDAADWFYRWKFDTDGNVREGWSYVNLLEWYWMDAKKSGTRNANGVTYHPKRTR